jgi:hypothetical protein
VTLSFEKPREGLHGGPGGVLGRVRKGIRYLGGSCGRGGRAWRCVREFSALAGEGASVEAEAEGGDGGLVERWSEIQASA